MATRGSLTDSSDADTPQNGETIPRLIVNGNSMDAERQGDPAPVCPWWTRVTENYIHTKVPRALIAVSGVAVRYPISCILLVVMLSFGILMLGLATNFYVDVDDLTVFTPFGVRARDHSDWVNTTFGDTVERRVFCMIHSEGANVVSRDNIRRVWDVLKTVEGTPGFSYLCTKSNYIDPGTDLPNCEISSVSRFWQHNLTAFEQQISSEEELREAISAENYKDSVPVDTETIIGKAKRVNGTITQAESLFLVFFIPIKYDGKFTTESVEKGIPDRLLALQEKWDAAGYGLNLEFYTERSYQDELQVAIYKDLPLIPLAFFIMTTFTCSVFARRDRVQSRMLLGIGSVITICMSLLTSFGFMFCCGVPFTNMTQLVPFVIFGVGLDDTFIIVASFIRSDPRKGIEERISATMGDVGLSITVSTVTTIFGFALGSLSTIPAVRWLCYYALMAICIDFVYQVTFFIALLVLDERRVKAHRGDLCCCCEVEDDASDDDRTPENCKVVEEEPNFIDRFMAWYAEQLFRPCIRVLVLVAFAALAAGCAYCASKFRQEFNVTELLPDGSYVTDFFDVFQLYYARSLPLNIYFRDVDHSDPFMRQQMVEYVDAMAKLDKFDDLVPFCWVKDLPQVLEREEFSFLRNMTFNEQVDALLGYRQVQEIYGDNIIRNDDGDIVASRCFLFLDNLDLNSVEEQTSLLREQERVTESLPVNQGRSNWAFFAYDDLFLTWEFYDAVVGQFVSTVVSGVVAVTAVAFVCLPHWSGMFFVFPMMVVLFVDLVGTIQFAGLYINVVSYVALSMAVGLLVDYVIHVLLRYYECPGNTREEKIKECLRTMGSAILVGGLSTLLGVVPLAFSTSAVMRTVFISFISMVTLGLGHGLIFLPVLLSIVGPVNHVPPSGETVLAALKPHQDALEHPKSNGETEEESAKVVDPRDDFLLPSFKVIAVAPSSKADPPGIVASDSGLDPSVAPDETDAGAYETISVGNSSRITSFSSPLDTDRKMPIDGMSVSAIVRNAYSSSTAGDSSARSTARVNLDITENGEDHINTIDSPNGLAVQRAATSDTAEQNGQLCVDVTDTVSACFPSQLNSPSEGIDV